MPDLDPDLGVVTERDPHQSFDSLFEQRASPDERNAPALGLAFSKLVIETHGGRILVESSGSQGSTYAFTLPIERRSDT